ncbi:hypothetical protein GGX14DRAFT_451920 [Mycena pura]|uniref:Queuosine 5'-phosphate N-glycosylase/hydrolase n=1 Tax=Mycena pura TaxID=153505 RepID=A0AAD6YH24_9AGAR|nr:hypothetical protein GGX14DRAFT_451920 [Mycena pura]
MGSVSFPPSGEFLQSIRASSKALREAANIIIDEQSIKRLLLSPAFATSFERLSASNGLAMPLNFPTAHAELNFWSIFALLNFGSGYRAPLHAETGGGASDCMKALAFALYISTDDDLMSARGMHNISQATVAELMRVNLHTEKPHETLQHVVVGELRGPMYDLVTMITRVLNETGGILVNMGYPDLGMFVLEALKDAGSKVRSDRNHQADVEVILERLVRAFPAFQDMAVVNGQRIFCFKKALFLIHAISVRFGSADPPPFPVPSTPRDLPVFSDNVLPSMLVHLGVIDISQSPQLLSVFPQAGSPPRLQTLLATAAPGTDANANVSPNDGPILSANQAYILRAAAIDACELMANVARAVDEPALDWLKDMQLASLDRWIWSVAKDRQDYRGLERFVLRDTVFF